MEIELKTGFSEHVSMKSIFTQERNLFNLERDYMLLCKWWYGKKRIQF